MWNWLLQNAQGISFFITLATLSVWIFYAQLLFFAFRRQRQAQILVTQGWGQQIDSVCLVANMSHEPVFIQQIVMTLRTGEGEYEGAITDFDTADPRNDDEVTRQGPLESGDHINLGTFRSLMRQSAKLAGLTANSDQPIRSLDIHNFKITVMASYGPEGGVIGAERRFLVGGKNNDRMRPVAIKTTRLKQRKAQKQMRRWMEQHI